MSGCDTTSCFYGKGKKGILKSFETKCASPQFSRLKEAVEAFKKPGQSPEDISANGIVCLLDIYKAPKKTESIDKYRYTCFTKGVVKKKAVNLATLPPTTDAAKYHFFRVYLQVQQWLSSKLSATEWGWSDTKPISPVFMTADPAPQELLNIMFCRCKKGCLQKCSCRQAGLKCSSACGSCQPGECLNLPELIVADDEDDIFNEEKDEEIDDIEGPIEDEEEDEEDS